MPDHLETRDHEADAADSNGARQLTLFTWLLAAAIFIHQVQLSDWEVLSFHLPVTLAAVWCMLRPSSLTRLLTLLGAHFISAMVDFPAVVNHWFLLTVVELGLVVALAYGWATSAAWMRNRAALYRALAPYIRIQVVLVYVFAALAKFNTGFLDPDTSCGPTLLADLFDKVPFGFDAGFLDYPSIWATIIIELALPVLLVVRATRVPTVFVGGGFHLTLAFTGHMAFSGFALAFYSLFVPDDVPARFDRLRERIPTLDAVLLGVERWGRSRLAFPLLVAGVVGLAAAITYGEEALETWMYRSVLALFVPYTLGLGAVLALCLAQGRPFPYRPGWLRLASPVWALAPLLVVINAFNPYLGLKTQHSFTMYSNLQTEPGHWNHVLVPEEARMFGLQDNVVTIVDSSDPELAEAAELDRDWTWWALRDRAADRPEISVTYERDGVVRTAAPAGSDPELGRSPNPFARKLLLFRDVPDEAGNTCRLDRDPAGVGQGT